MHSGLSNPIPLVFDLDSWARPRGAQLSAGYTVPTPPHPLYSRRLYEQARNISLPNASGHNT